MTMTSARQHHPSRTLWFGICVLAAFVGPLVSFVASHAYPFVHVTDDRGVVLETNAVAQAVVGTFIDAAALLWPPQVLGAIEYSIGTLLSGLVLYGLNICLYLFLGWLILMAARKKWRLTALSLAIAAYLVAFSLWGAGYDLTFVNWASLVVGAAFYGTLILLGTRMTLSRAAKTG